MILINECMYLQNKKSVISIHYMFTDSRVAIPHMGLNYGRRYFLTVM